MSMWRRSTVRHAEQAAIPLLLGILPVVSWQGDTNAQRPAWFFVLGKLEMARWRDDSGIPADGFRAEPTRNTAAI
jgi:hypothetical protein